MDRRRFLLLTGAATAAVVLRAGDPPRAWARRPAGVALQPWSLPFEAPGSGIDQARALIGAAVLAPSHWNTQPWRFEVEGESVRLLLDPRRALPALDPGLRASHLALGAALENLLVLSRAWGLRTSVRYAPGDRVHGVAAEVAWNGREARRDRTLAPWIVQRRTNRHDYDGRAILMLHAAQLTAQASDSVRLHWVDDRGTIRGLADFVHDVTRAGMMDRRAEAERFAWLRPDDEAERRGDGVAPDVLEVGIPGRWFARRWFDPHGSLLRFGAGSLAHQARDGVRSAGAVALLTTSAPGPTGWLMAGQAWERVALKATQLEIAHQPLHAPLEQPAARAEVARRFGAAGEEPLMFVRFGHARRVPPSPRRAVALVTSFRNS